ncbi:transpeptidase family protein [Myxococcota bacterium]|nr:transpeptidase family protein [Myxococcota bacterium]
MSARRPSPDSPRKRRDPRPLAVVDHIALRPAVERESDGALRARSTARVLFVGAMILAGYGVLFGKAGALMLLPDERLESQASGQFEATIEVRGRRGEVRDRNGAILATTVDLRELHVDPGELSEDGRRRMAQVMAAPTGADLAELTSRLLVPGKRDVRLARGLTPEELSQLRGLVEGDKELERSLFVRRDRRRFYPGRADAASLLGVVGANGIGLAGLERALDGHLQGQVVKFVQWHDRKGRSVTMDERDAEPGSDVVLTIDRRIQRVTEQALNDALISTGATTAYAVVTDVHTGEILAMVTVPGINPNDQADLDIQLLKNRAAMDAIEPGSVFKPFVAAAALDTGMVTPTTVLDCEGGAWMVGTKLIKDEHGFHEGTLREVIKFSSNVCAAKLALELGPEKALGYLSAFGFGRSTGLDLPGETRGLLRSPQGIRRIELATTAYGYGASANAVQLASAMATLGNGGVRMEPRLVKEIRDPRGDLVARYEPEAEGRVVAEEHARTIVEMMVAVTQKGGTGTKAAVPGYLVAGKTGTAKKLEGGNYSGTARMGSFVGLIPADDPVLSIAVVVDSPTIGPRFGGWTAAPAFKQIAQNSMRILGVAPDPVLLAEATPSRPAAEPATEPAEPLAPVAPAELTWQADGSLRLPDLSGLSMRDALVSLQGAGLAVRVTGSGRVAEQVPAAGSPLRPGAEVEVLLR